ncbi:MAG: ferritin [Methanomassiliicoccales archaeon]
MNERIEEAFNEQMNAEMYSAYLYLSMNAYFHSQDLPGMANWMRVQAQEEMTHAMKFYDYIVEKDGRPALKEIEAPPREWDSPLAVFQHQLEHEQKVTAMINNLVDIAIEEKDHATNNFLQWFVAEQVEEESNARDLVTKAKRVGDGYGVYMLDKELAARPPKLVMAAPAGDPSEE